MSLDSIVRLHQVKQFDEYFSSSNQAVAEKIPLRPGRILDIGCAEGALAEQVMREKQPEAYEGIEILPHIAEKAKTILNRVYVGSAEQVVPELAPQSYDWIIMADSLEHMVDPWEILRQVARLLKPGGRLILSIPNIRNLNVIIDLFLRGRWTYKPWGIMDQGHLRFFTLSSLQDLLTEQNYQIISCTSNPRNRWKRLPGKAAARVLSWLIGQPSAYEEFITVQWIVEAKKLGV
ncbi:class I SAM-dependent methyltransferase [bacterium]|nr:class I SAM-dependent methyltransferase [bacterium]